MKFSDEQIQDILKLKDHIIDEIEKHKEEIDMLQYRQLREYSDKQKI